MGIHYRQYESYRDYLSHQRSKLVHMRMFFRKNFDKRYAAIHHRIRDIVQHLPRNFNRKVLCLGARLGEEVKAFIDIGYSDSIGIDLNPGIFNKYVKKGDFHNLQFGDGSVDIIYSNCLDHAHDLERVMKESYRVLAKDGHLCIELSTSNKLRQKEHLSRNSNWESMIWESYEDVIGIVKEHFSLIASFESFDHNYMSYAFKKSI